ncbi:MAG: CPBP family intramembrane metalloprotease [Promethearchaeota archaeon]|nr:MAG: CPBP family intramembrane metalloprotease [Candidatus Lokiarchaeota archaeon]
MNEEKVQGTKNTEKTINYKLKWSFCPICGQKIPENQKVKYCVKCGVDLYYIQEHMRVPSPQNLKPLRPQLPQKFSDEELLDLKSRKLWSSAISIIIPFGAFIFMNIIAFVLIFIIVLLNINSGNLFDLVTNPYVTIISSLSELVFIIIPVLYVGKYLKNPSIANRFAILGFTTRGYNKTGILKEILLGFGFAIAGIFLVAFTSIFIEILLELIFGTEIIYEFGTFSGEIDAIINNSDTLSLVLLLIIMILVIGTSEEVLFRGFMQKGLVRTIGIKWGIITTAIIFSLIHLIGLFILFFDSPFAFLISFLLSFVPYFAISLLLGIIFHWRKENLIAVMITHGVYDALTILLAFMIFNVF